jgi:hypothetical protein
MGPIRALWNKSTQENRDALRPFSTKEATYFQYTEKFTFLAMPKFIRHIINGLPQTAVAFRA